MSVQVETLKQHHFRGQRRNVGETYEVTTANDLNVVKAMGWAKRVEAPAPAAETQTKAAGTYARRDMVAKPAAAPAIAPPAAPAPAVAEAPAPASETEKPADQVDAGASEKTSTAAKKTATTRTRKADE